MKELIHTRGFHALINLIDQLKEHGVYRDDEGEETMALKTLVSDIGALNAPADLEHQSVGKPVAWLLTDKNINDIQIGSVQRLIDRARQAHFTDLIIRINGKDERHQADWLKHLVRATPPLNAPADRTYEQENAIKEGHRNKIEDDYFDARPNFNQVHHRAFFSGGFDRGWDAAKKDAPADRDVMRQTLEGIANAEQGDWDKSMRDDSTFKIWAQSRARYALAAPHTPPAEQPNYTHADAADRDVMRQAPEGWKLAPIEPTQAMVDGAFNAYRDWRMHSDGEPGNRDGYKRLYKAMLAVAPTPPAEWQGKAEYPAGEVIGPCVCGSWPGGECFNCPKVEQQGEQEPAAYRYRFYDPLTSDAIWRYSPGSWNGQHPHEAQPLYTHPATSLATLRPKVEALPTFANCVDRDAVLAEIDKLGGGV